RRGPPRGPQLERRHGRSLTMIRGALCSAGLLAGLHFASVLALAQATPAAPPAAPLADTAGLPVIMREFRGVWIATVDNIDWPSKPGLSSGAQQRELRVLLDRAVELRLNAVIFQVRPSADALYASKLEPWSYFLTGRQGRAPRPAYDPLAFAVKEAHARGLELHAWFNPYRARHPAEKQASAPSHVSRTHPGLVRRYASYLWMDPGEAAVRQQTLRVVLDVVRRYDVDGVHIDDYFYPYPEGGNDFPDEATFRRYAESGGSLPRADWRRANVDSLVHELYSGIKKTKPWVKFGISPFGIWRPGYPESVRGLDAYDRLFADARKWMNEGWGDYFTPQLYWRTDAPEQRYLDLLGWWIGENRMGRHVWPGNYTSRATSAARNLWDPSEVVAQIRLTRLEPGASGNVHFSMKAFGVSASLAMSLTRDVYGEPALVPPSPWLADSAPRAPRVTAKRHGTDWELRLTPQAGAVARLWTVRWKGDADWRSIVVPGTQRSVVINGAKAAVVTTIDRVGMESTPVVLGLTGAAASVANSQ
ncbi:MAG: glycoside hydrolase family 10 protein, partial [Gemmatimonadaceae bacterium]